MEWHHITNTAYNNNTPKTAYPDLDTEYKGTTPGPKPPHSQTPPTPTRNTKCTTFTYTSPQIKTFTNLFRHTKVRVAHKCTNTISHLSKPINKENAPPHPTTEVASTNSHEWHAKFVCGSNQSNLRQRYKEHTRYIKNNNPQSAYALHFLNNQHEYGPIEQIMTLQKPSITALN